MSNLKPIENYVWIETTGKAGMRANLAFGYTHGGVDSQYAGWKVLVHATEAKNFTEGGHFRVCDPQPAKVGSVIPPA